MKYLISNILFFLIVCVLFSSCAGIFSLSESDRLNMKIELFVTKIKGDWKSSNSEYYIKARRDCFDLFSKKSKYVLNGISPKFIDSTQIIFEGYYGTQSWNTDILSGKLYVKYLYDNESREENLKITLVNPESADLEKTKHETMEWNLTRPSVIEKSSYYKSTVESVRSGYNSYEERIIQIVFNTVTLSENVIIYIQKVKMSGSNEWEKVFDKMYYDAGSYVIDIKVEDVINTFYNVKVILDKQEYNYQLYIDKKH